MGKVVTVLTEEAPKPLGHYSQAVRGGGLIHISGPTADREKRRSG